MEQVLEQPTNERKSIQVKNGLVGELHRGDILLDRGNVELVTDVNFHGAQVLYRVGSEIISHAKRAVCNRLFQSPIEVKYYHLRSTDTFEIECYQIADKMLTEAGL